MLESFKAELPKTMENIKHAYHHKDKSTLKDQVHYLHGAVSYLYLIPLKRACNSLEGAIVDDFSDAEIASLYQDLMIAIETFL